MSYYSIHASNKTLLYIQNIPLFLIGSIPLLILHNQREKIADISHAL